MKFLRNTFEEMIISVLLLCGLWQGLQWFQDLDPTMGVPDASVIVLLGWQVVKLYLAVFIGHGLFRLLAPSLADFADDGTFAAEWKASKGHNNVSNSAALRMAATITVAFLCFFAALTALLLAP